MLNHKLAALLSLNAILSFGQVSFEASNDHTDKILNEISNREDIVGASVSIGVHDSIVFSKGYGLANKELNIRTQSFHKFRIYSLSKHLTGVAIAKLVEDGKLNIDNPISDYIPFINERLSNITTAQLLTHTSGIRSYAEGEWQKVSDNPCISPFESILAFQSDELLFEPGSDYSYTSFGYVLLSAIIEKVSGKPFIDYLQQDIFKPLGVNGITLDNVDIVDHLAAQPYEYWKGVMYRARYANNTCKFGGGGLSSSTLDLVILNLAILNGKLIAEENLPTMFTSLRLNNGEQTDYGFGLQYEIDENGSRYAWHSGRSRGGRNALVIYPEKKLVVCISANTNGDSIVEEAESIAKMYLKEMN